MSEFDDLLAANAEFATTFQPVPTGGRAVRGVAIVTCMDSRLDPLRMVGLRPGDAKILRNAGARVGDEVVRTLVLARYLLDVERVMVIAHTQCRMSSGSEADLHAAITAAGGPDTGELTFGAVADQEAALRADVERLRSAPYLGGLAVGGFVYDVTSGRISRVC